MTIRTRPRNDWSRSLTFTPALLPQPPPQLYSLNQSRHLPSKYMFAPHVDVPQLYYRQDPRVAHKFNCTCRLRCNLSVKNSLQPAARKHVTCEHGIPSSAHSIPVYPFPVMEDESHSDSKALLNLLKLARTKGRTTTKQHVTTHLREEHSSSPFEPIAVDWISLSYRTKILWEPSKWSKL
jgi:hypothetical protein